VCWGRGEEGEFVKVFILYWLSSSSSFVRSTIRRRLLYLCCDRVFEGGETSDSVDWFPVAFFRVFFCFWLVVLSLLNISFVFCSFFLKFLSRFVIRSSLASSCESFSDMYSVALDKAAAVACVAFIVSSVCILAFRLLTAEEI